MKKWILGIFICLLLTCTVCAQEDRDLRQLNERLEKNKAEIIKEIQNYQADNEEAISESIDENFAVLDDRMQSFFKGATRDMAVIVVAGFMAGFTLSQVVKIKVEQMRRKNVVREFGKLEDKTNQLRQEAVKLTNIVRKLQKMEKKYSSKLEGMKPKRFFNVRTILFAVFTFVVGAGIMYAVVG